MSNGNSAKAPNTRRGLLEATGLLRFGQENPAALEFDFSGSRQQQLTFQQLIPRGLSL